MLIYHQEECVRKALGICWKYETKKYSYDLTNKEVRKQLIDMGFVAKVRAR